MSTERIVVPGAKMDGDKNPSLRRTSQGRRVRSGSEGHNALASLANACERSPSPAWVGVPGCGLLRKSASSVALGSALENEFSPAGQTTVSTITLSAASTEDSSIACTSSGARACPGSYLNATTPPFPVDRGTEVTVHNAQGIWPAEAVVFVANLCVRRSLEQLEQACHDLFDPFGRNFIKIKLDRNKHPFALVQFEKIEAANTALASSQGVFLDGRPIRLEHGRAERAVIISRKDGAAMTERDARAALEPFGALAALLRSDSVCGGGPSFLARFVYYQGCRDALQAISGLGSSVYRLQLATDGRQREQGSRPPPRGLRRRVGGATRAEDSERRQSHEDDEHDEDDEDDEYDGQEENSHHAINYHHHHLTSSNSQGARARARARADTTTGKTIFVGNLPPHTTSDTLAWVFSATGTVVDARVITKRYSGDVHTFGFVEFTACAEAEAAIYAPANKYLDGWRLRVERRRAGGEGGGGREGVGGGAPAGAPGGISGGLHMENWRMDMGMGMGMSINMAPLALTPGPSPGPSPGPAPGPGPVPAPTFFYPPPLPLPPQPGLMWPAMGYPPAMEYYHAAPGLTPYNPFGGLMSSWPGNYHHAPYL